MPHPALCDCSFTTRIAEMQQPKQCARTLAVLPWVALLAVGAPQWLKAAHLRCRVHASELASGIQVLGLKGFSVGGGPSACVCARAQPRVDLEADPPGKIDNSALMKQYPKFRDLREGLVEGTDFVAVSEKSWIQLNSWYAHPTPPQKSQTLLSHARQPATAPPVI